MQNPSAVRYNHYYYQHRHRLFCQLVLSLIATALCQSLIPTNTWHIHAQSLANCGKERENAHQTETIAH